MANISITRSWTSGGTTATYKLTVPYTVTNTSNTKTQIELGSFSTIKTGSGAAATLRDNAIANGLVLSFKLNGEDNSAVTLWQINTKNDIVQDTIGKTYSWTRTKEDNKTRAIWVMMTGVSHESQTINIPVKPSREINYDANGGTGTVSSQIKWYGENLTLRSNSFTKTNSSFYHWNTTSTNTGTSYKAGATYTSNSTSNNPLILYAIWNPIITYNANGGSGTVSSQTKTYGTAINLKSNSFTKTGYSFYHWNTTSNNSGTSYNAGASYIGNNPLTLYAIWNPIITYNANGGSGTVSSQTKTYGTNITLKSNSFTRSGYVFSHWNTASNNTGTKYNAGATYTGNTALTLYAIWNPIITYNANGGTGSNITQTKTYGTAAKIKTNSFTRTNYNFYHWNTKSNNTGTTYAPNNSYTTEAPVTLYAIWNSIITYKANGGSGTVQPQNKTYGTAVTLKSNNAFTKTDYEINQWNTVSNGTGTSYAPNSSYAKEKSITLYAIWERVYATPVLTFNDVYRSNSEGTSVDNGNYITINVKFQVFKNQSSAKITLHYEENDSSVSGDLSKTFNANSLSSSSDGNWKTFQGNITFAQKFDQNKAYSIKVTLQDSSNSGRKSQKTKILATIFFPIDISQGGLGMALGGAASASGLDIYYKTQFSQDVSLPSIYATAGSTTTFNSNVNDLPSGIILAKSGNYTNVPTSRLKCNSIYSKVNSSNGNMDTFYLTQGYHGFYADGEAKMRIKKTGVEIVEYDNPPFQWRYETSEAFTLAADEGKTYNFLSSSFTMPNISGYTRIVIPRTSNTNTVATGYAFNDDNTLNVYVRNLRSSSSSLYVRVLLFYLRNDLQWT